MRSVKMDWQRGRGRVCGCVVWGSETYETTRGQAADSNSAASAHDGLHCAVPPLVAGRACSAAGGVQHRATEKPRTE